jgi:pimeloyl-ACP methyl ester carboxylesterase
MTEVRQSIPHWPGELVSIDDRRRLFVRTAAPRDGSAEPGLFLHGFASTSADFTDFMHEVRDVVAGEAVDLPGYGFSPAPPDRDYSIAAHARSIVGLIEERERGPVHLAGNSLGGMIGIRVAAHRPDLVRSLTLLAPALPDRRAYVRAGLLALPSVPYAGERLLGPLLRRVPAERRVRIRYEHDFHDLTSVTPDRWADAVAELERHDALPHADEQFFRTLRGAVADWLRQGERSLWRAAERLTVPTLVVWGLQDRVLDPRLAVSAARRIPGARLALIPGCGHMPQVEKPVESAREFRAFVTTSV